VGVNSIGCKKGIHFSNHRHFNFVLFATSLLDNLSTEKVQC